MEWPTPGPGCMRGRGRSPVGERQGPSVNLNRVRRSFSGISIGLNMAEQPFLNRDAAPAVHSSLNHSPRAALR